MNGPHRRAPLVGLALALPAVLCPLGADVRAYSQSVDTLPREPLCLGCRLDVCAQVSLGEERGEGFVDWPVAIASTSRFTFLVNRSADREIRVFDSLGAFVKVLGREGEGPGEYRSIWQLEASVGDTLHVVDIGNLRHTVLSPELDVVRIDRLLARPQKKGFLPLPDGGFLLNALYPAADGKVRVLHRFDARGERLASFGDLTDVIDPASLSPEASWRVPALAEDLVVYAAAADGFSVDAWTLDGARLRSLVPLERGWNANASSAIAGSGPRIVDLRVDSLGRLWVLVRVQDPRWEAAVARTAPRLGSPPTVEILDYNGYWDSEIEVWDLRAQKVVVRGRFPDYYIGFLEAGAVYSFHVAEGEGARVHLDALCVRGGSSHPEGR